MASFSTHGARGGTVLSVGIVVFDIAMVCDGFPSADSKTRALRSLSGGGGNAANASVACARLLDGAAGSRVRFVTRFGDDCLATQLRAELEAERLDLSCARAGASRSATSAILVAGATRTIVHDAGINELEPLRAEDICVGGDGADGLDAVFDGVSLVQLDGRHPHAAPAVAARARARRVALLVEAEREREELAALLAHADMVIASPAFATPAPAEDATSTGWRVYDPMSGAFVNAPSGELANQLAAAASALARAPRARWIIVTLGAKGSIAIEMTGSGRSEPSHR